MWLRCRLSTLWGSPLLGCLSTCVCLYLPFVAPALHQLAYAFSRVSLITMNYAAINSVLICSYNRPNLSTKAVSCFCLGLGQPHLCVSLVTRIDSYRGENPVYLQANAYWIELVNLVQTEYLDWEYKLQRSTSRLEIVSKGSWQRK